MQTINGGQLYRIRNFGKMMDFRDDYSLDFAEDTKFEMTEYDVYEEISRDSLDVTVKHLQLNKDFVVTHEDLCKYFYTFDYNEVILRPRVPHKEILKFARENLELSVLRHDSGLIFKVCMDSFNAESESLTVKIQYSLNGYKFRKFTTVIRLISMDSFLKIFYSPESRFITDMNLFDFITVDGAPQDKYYFYGYSLSDGNCRIINENADKNKFIFDRVDFRTIEFGKVDIWLPKADSNLLVAGEEKEDEEGKCMSKFNVMNDTDKLVFPKGIKDGLLVTFKSGVVHLLVNNLSLCKGSSFSVIEVSKTGDLGVWGSSFESMMDYYNGLNSLKLQVQRFDNLNDFSLVNKILLNK